MKRMNSRETILQSVRDHKPAPVALPTRARTAPPPMDVLDRFVFHLDGIGGVTRFFESRQAALETLKQSSSGLMLRDLIQGESTIQEDSVTEPDVTAVEARFAVAENGAVYITDQEVGHRQFLFLGRKLIALVPKNALVPDMHEAYDRIKLSSVGFGIFIAGSSATADIAQILVRGAHGPAEMEVWFYGQQSKVMSAE